MAESATRSALQGLRQEETAMREGYEVLDQKRILLMQEIRRQKAAYDQEWPVFAQACQQAMALLRLAVLRHGLEGLQLYPALAWQTPPALLIHSGNLLGVQTVDAQLKLPGDSVRPASNPSPEADSARQQFADLTVLAASFAARLTTLERLARSYQRTERRARALEEVLLPEIRQRIAAMTAAIEAMEQEDTLRIAGRRPHH